MCRGVFFNVSGGWAYGIIFGEPSHPYANTIA